jgi:hypothetical protein
MKRKNRSRRDQMQFKIKIAIFLVALLVTFAGFNLLASTSILDIFDLKGVRGADVVVTVTANQGLVHNTVVQFGG